MIITLKVLPHVKQFVITKFSDPVQITEKNWQSDILTFRMKSQLKKNSFSIAKDRMVDLQVEINKILSDNFKGKLLNYQLSNYYDSLFKDTMCAHVEAQSRAGFAITNSIVDFFQMHGIDEDSISIPTAYKIYQRYLEKKKKK